MTDLFLNFPRLFWSGGEFVKMQPTKEERVVDHLDRAAYSPAEFAALFGRSPTWGYRRIYDGDIDAKEIAGRAMISREEVFRFIQDAPRYEGRPRLPK